MFDVSAITGGAMYFDFSNDIGRIQLSTFDGNEATGNGGAVFLGCKVSYSFIFLLTTQRF
jgi:predicted outer membrane repeat protein